MRAAQGSIGAGEKSSCGGGEPEGSGSHSVIEKNKENYRGEYCEKAIGGRTQVRSRLALREDLQIVLLLIRKGERSESEKACMRKEREKRNGLSLRLWKVNPRAPSVGGTISTG